MGRTRIQIDKGERYAMLEVIREVAPVQYPYKLERRFLCRCDCGRWKTVRMTNLRSGNTISCGCQNGRAYSGRRD